MALPIKANDTQEGCNPISSNCVIWQGPDIPCISLCRGDSVSDVVAKLAEELCAIVDELKISMYDLSVFNPMCPTPDNFQQLIQLIIDNVGQLLNASTGGTVTPIGCPDCIVEIAPCLRTTDALGNQVNTLQLKDYVILIGNRICTIITDITALDTRVTTLETAVKDIQDNCCNSSPADITVPGSVCIFTGTPVNIPIVDFVVQLESAFCALQTAVGTPSVISTTISSQCIDGSMESVSRTGVTYANLPNWVNPANLAQTVTDLWVVVCDYRTAIQALQSTVLDLQAQLNQCCGATCASIVWSINTIQGLRAQKFIDIFFTGSPVPSSFDYCTPSASTITVTNMASPPVTATYSVTTGTNDIINAINNNSSIAIDVSTPGSPVTEGSIWYEVYIELCVTDGNVTCTSNTTTSLYNGAWCAGLGATATSLGTGDLTLNFTPFSTAIATTYSAQVFTNSTLLPVTPVVPIVGSTYSWAGLPAGNYYVKLYSLQFNSRYQGKDLSCSTNLVAVS
jgi:hypothetical protein